ncbi:rhomboid family intramembrane serine protease [Sporobolomyces salmoneus]|uniref:rhomboid family intramembrane serine protease n=1 Tax=Sporobolomyces salmoneus TaxID=183962 RepID=UPI003180A446
MFKPTQTILSPLRTRRARPPTRTDFVLDRRVGRQFAFALSGSVLAFGGAAWMTNKDTEERNKGYWSSWGRRHGTGLQPDLARSRFEESFARAKAWVKQFPNNRLVVILNEKWLEMGEAKRTQAGLIASFATVFVLWRLPASARFGKWLAHDPLSGRSITQLTSVFSHRTLPHLAFNSIALYSFGTACFSYLNYSELLPRSTSRYEFLAFFAAAGLASSFASHLWFSRIVAGRLLRTTTSQQVRASIVPSLGASGAVYSCLTLTALSFPESNVSLIFIPFVPLPIGAATGALVLVDLVGLFRGWRMFDHAAHLAGAAFGAGYWYIGHEWFEKLRVRMIKMRNRDRAIQ